MLLATELKQHGCAIDPNQFEEALVDAMATINPSYTVEQLICRSDDVARFVTAVKARCGRGLPGEMILRRLLNLRKRGSIGKRPGKARRKPVKK